MSSKVQLSRNEMLNNNTTYQDNFPEQQQNLLDRKVRGITTAELGDHCKQHHSKTIFSRHRKHWTKTTDKKYYHTITCISCGGL